MRTHLLFLLIGLVFLASPASAQVDQLLKGITGSGVTDSKASAGLKEALEVAKTQSFDLDNYVTGKALDGLFHVVGEQEELIRTNPAARTTVLLQEVFAKK
jgi:hypothetical protein